MLENTDYGKILQLDADTITASSFDEVWLEANHGLLLYNIGHSYNHKDRQSIVKDFNRLYDYTLVHYGGELVGGTQAVLKKFMAECESVYRRVKDCDYDIAVEAGDETIISIAALEMSRVIDAGVYIYRYWTGSFYLISTNYVNNPVAIWHVPSEKRTGILRIYKMLARGIIPSKGHMSKLLGFPRARRPFSLRYLAEKLLMNWRRSWIELGRRLGSTYCSSRGLWSPIYITPSLVRLWSVTLSTWEYDGVMDTVHLLREPDRTSKD